MRVRTSKPLVSAVIAFLSGLGQQMEIDCFLIAGVERTGASTHVHHLILIQPTLILMFHLF